ncbi:hypothetical protein [Streptomyces buecherae]|uniref:hypothetical protein n=1 Tax=Streptomyces buecherae TaxID=2763006 RepID=UPI001C2804F5|nr:hypothetical protein [Streptomyces buecherae]
MRCGETRDTALVDLRLCASLLVIVVVLVALVVLSPTTWLRGEGAVSLSPYIAPGLLCLAGLSRRSYLRVVRFHRT